MDATSDSWRRWRGWSDSDGRGTGASELVACVYKQSGWANQRLADWADFDRSNAPRVLSLLETYQRVHDCVELRPDSDDYCTKQDVLLPTGCRIVFLQICTVPPLGQHLPIALSSQPPTSTPTHPGQHPNRSLRRSELELP